MSPKATKEARQEAVSQLVRSGLIATTDAVNWKWLRPKPGGVEAGASAASLPRCTPQHAGAYPPPAPASNLEP